MRELFMQALLIQAKSTTRTTTEVSLTSHSLSSTYVLLLIHLRYLVSTTWVCRSLSCHWFSEKYTLQHNDCSKKKKPKNLIFFLVSKWEKFRQLQADGKNRFQTAPRAWTHPVITAACPHTSLAVLMWI